MNIDYIRLKYYLLPLKLCYTKGEEFMKITNMRKGSWGKLTAFFDVVTEEGFTVKGFKLVQGINGIFVGFPSQKGKDDDNEYYDTVWAEKDLKEELSRLAIDYYGQEAMPTDNDMTNSSTGIDSETASTTSIDTSEAITDDDIPF